MKKLFLSLLFIIATLASMAQSVGEAFYIYRNDGQFNAFFREEVDSIVYSCYDADSIFQNDIVTQLVYTVDSIYRIPLAAIDSVGFTQPETIYNTSVIQIDQLLPYIHSVDGMTIHFNGNMPHDLQPNVGDVLLYEKFQNPFPNGFAGKVNSTDRGDYYVVSCDTASFEEIYDRIVSYETFDINEPTMSRRAPGDPNDFNPNREGYHLQVSTDGTLRSHGVSLNGDFYIRGTGRWIRHRESGQPTYSDLSMTVDITTDAEVSWTQGVKIDHDFDDLFDIPVRLPNGLQGTLALTPFVELSSTFGLKNEFSSFQSYTIGARTENGQLHTYFSPVFHVDEPKTIMKGEVELYAGAKLTLSFGAAMNIARVSGSVSGGFYAKGELKAADSSIDNTDNYELSKDDVVTTSIRAALDVSAGLYLTNAVKLESKYRLGAHDFFKFDHYILPLFEKPTYKRNEEDKTKIGVTLPVKRDLIGDVNVGLALFDANHHLIDTKFEEERPYRVEANFANNPVELTFTGVETDKLYTVSPVVRILDQEYLATPALRIGTPIKVQQTEAKGKTGGEVTFKASLTLTAPIEQDDDASISEYGIAILYGDECIKEYPITDYSQPIEIELTCHSDSLTEDWANYVATTEGKWFVTTYTDNNETGHIINLDEKQDLVLIYDQEPSCEFISVEYDPSSFEQETKYLDDGLGHTATYQWYCYWWNVYRRHRGTYWWRYLRFDLKSNYHTNGTADPIYNFEDDENYKRRSSVEYSQSWYYSESTGFHDFYWEKSESFWYAIITLRNDNELRSLNGTLITGDGSTIPDYQIVDLDSTPSRKKVKRSATTILKDDERVCGN